MELTMSIGKDKDGKVYLCLGDLVTDEKVPVAEFLFEKLAAVFTLFMNTQGYAAIDLPTDEDFDALLDGQ